MQKTVAVIGGSGFIGRAVTEMLAREGQRVVILCRNAERAKYLKPMGGVGQITPVAGNASDDTALEQVIASADAVVNLVGILAEGGGQKFAALQAELPGRIGALAAKHGVSSVVHLSAIGADVNSDSVYARSKGQGEANLQAAFPKAVILRPSIVFGPRDSFFNRFAGMAVIAPALPLPGGGMMRMQPVYVGDVAEAVAVGLGLRKAKQNPAGKIYELGGPDVYSFRQLMEMTMQQTRRRRLLVPVPLSLMSMGALVTGLLPNPPLTKDQVRLLAKDNVVTTEAATLGDLGIVATPVASILPSYLARFRPGGAFAD